MLERSYFWHLWFKINQVQPYFSYLKKKNILQLGVKLGYGVGGEGGDSP